MSEPIFIEHAQNPHRNQSITFESYAASDKPNTGIVPTYNTIFFMA